MTKLALNDIQGIIRRGYGDMRHACFVLLKIGDAASARPWLELQADAITDGEHKPPEGRLNLAFTCAGLAKFGLHEAVLRGFSREFREGMTAGDRPRILGDYGTSAPEMWDWGGPNGPAPHVLLLLYAPSEQRLSDFYASQRAGFEAAGLSQVRRLDTIRLDGRKEHFGFRDGIAQPEIEGTNKGAPPENIVAPGEFLFGYRNESGKYPDGPGEFGRNGSYLVFRQLEQHVREFWQFLDRAAQEPDGGSDPAARVRLGSKMVGRWPSGAPFSRDPNRDPDHGKREQDLATDAVNDRFGFHHDDPRGELCPLGSHIRRTNPRDTLAPSPKISIRNSNLHRIIRRGRAYGPPVAASMDPQDILRAEADAGERGLHFVCFNTDLAQQFEFLQQDWINSPKFEGMFYRDVDPIVGAQDPIHPEYTDAFTVQAKPVRTRVPGILRFVDVRGGAYFFMPGIRAIRYLARRV
jgi:Dyp-type peroxidase family